MGDVHAEARYIANEEAIQPVGVEITIRFAETWGMPGYSSITLDMAAKMILGREYTGRDAPERVSAIIDGLCDKTQRRVVDRSYAELGPSIKRHIIHYEKVLDAEDKLKADRVAAAIARDEQRRAEELAARQQLPAPSDPPFDEFAAPPPVALQVAAPAPAPGPMPAAFVPQVGQAVVGIWDGARIVCQPAPTAAPAPAPAPAPRPQPPAAYSPQPQSGPPAGRKEGTPPSNAGEFGGWMKHQSKEVKALVKGLMDQYRWGWEWKSLTDQQAMWLYGQVCDHHAAPVANGFH